MPEGKVTTNAETPILKLMQFKGTHGCDRRVFYIFTGLKKQELGKDGI